MKHVYWKVAMIVMTLFFCMNAYAYDFEANGIFYGYNASDQTAYVTHAYMGGGIKYSGIIEIPSYVTYNGKEMAVTKIGNNAFQNCTELNSIVIPNTIEEIGAYAFKGCI